MLGKYIYTKMYDISVIYAYACLFTRVNTETINIAPFIERILTP